MERAPKKQNMELRENYFRTIGSNQVRIQKSIVAAHSIKSEYGF